MNILVIGELGMWCFPQESRGQRQTRASVTSVVLCVPLPYDAHVFVFPLPDQYNKIHDNRCLNECTVRDTYFVPGRKWEHPFQNQKLPLHPCIVLVSRGRKSPFSRFTFRSLGKQPSVTAGCGLSAGVIIASFIRSRSPLFVVIPEVLQLTVIADHKGCDSLGQKNASCF